MTTRQQEPGETCCGPSSSEVGDDAQVGVTEDSTSNTANKFSIDYSKRGTAKCKICKKCIPKNELRIGVYTVFKGKTITYYHHVACCFLKMKKARVELNVIQSPKDIDGFEEISEADQEVIVKLIDEDKSKRKAPFPLALDKKRPVRLITASERRKKLTMLKVPSIKVLFTNADQFTHAKKNELEQRIVTEKPMIVAVSEVKPKNGREMCKIDFSIDGYTINQVNLDKESGRGIIVYTHNCLEKSAVQSS